MRLEGKVAVITGGARGQGAAEGALFAREGARVIVADVDEEAGRAVAAGFGGTFVRLDVSAEDGWEAALDGVVVRYGRLDVLVNNAARYRTKPLAEESVAALDGILAVNLRGPFLGIRAAAKRMEHGGSIINVSSTAGMTGYPGHGAYGMSKWALRGLTKVAAAELAPQGIRVNCLIPGAIEGPMLEQSIPPELLADPAHWAGTPIGRAGRPDEVARAALFLASEDSSYLTGTELVVDGGATGTG
ncbi:SDR family NAD(P)-dependent oxidoreductase [Amycolatopsis circi]|uniref:SDR family NAD(P)-dependent oxidoreductase n=1 Tax=Amycolatopsis circi TaxID=871959 RepID=UPI000E28276D|nr:glucose 1-dehydrogenase [Amycolatopsis circi]